jgi:hypothetical protein
LVGIGILVSVRIFLKSRVQSRCHTKFFQEAQASSAGLDRLNDIFRSMGRFFDDLPPDPSVDTSENIMLEVLSILTTTTVAIRQGEASELIFNWARISFLLTLV